MQNVDPRDDGDIGESPDNKLVTPLGRFIDRVTYGQVAGVTVLLILASAIYFWLATGVGNGFDKKDQTTFGEALYFSVITFTTVGYGDLTPVGWGRMVVSVEVLAGLVLTALFIGKIASERQAALLLLIYTSEQQRRIAAFAGEIQSFSLELSKYREVDEARAEDCANLLRSLRAYLVFQSHQGRLADFGNASALRNLYRSLQGLLAAILHAFNSQPLEPMVEEQLLKAVDRVGRLARIMSTFHVGDKGTLRPLGHIEDLTQEIAKWEATAVTWRRLRQVQRVVPNKPWPKHFHKAAAAQLGISPTLFRRCMEQLIASHRI